ncbi:MAG: Ig-like domain-containing protein [Eubacteriales bacterium]|nr:Ig-like domain-containing protein [Eubacteriales bacterium]
MLDKASYIYASSNKSIATVSKTGVIKAKKKGTCTVYVYARNGYAKTIKVIVNKPLNEFLLK